MRPLGRREPTDWNHISKYRLVRADIDTLRATIRDGVPFVVGINWYASFDNPVKKPNGYWVTDMSGGIRGGHALCFMDASDKRQAFRTLNTWGPFYPPTWFPYALVERLLAEQGEAVVLVP